MQNIGYIFYMKELSILESQLLEEYERCWDHLVLSENEVIKCPKGYITTKIINGSIYNYLQWREGKHVKSRYIKDNELDDIFVGVKRRRSLEENIKQLKKDIKILEKALGKEIINGSRRQGI